MITKEHTTMAIRIATVEKYALVLLTLRRTLRDNNGLDRAKFRAQHKISANFWHTLLDLGWISTNTDAVKWTGPDFPGETEARQLLERDRELREHSKSADADACDASMAELNRELANVKLRLDCLEKGLVRQQALPYAEREGDQA